MSGRIAIIPARGGSKRIPRKNVVPFMGKPMLAWTVEAALGSRCFDQVLVSTEDEQIAQVARGAGADVPFLRAADHDDQTPVSRATLGALQQAEAHWRRRFGMVVQLMPNCPLRGAGHVKAAVEHFAARRAKFQISCFKFGWMNPWWAARLDAQGAPTLQFPDAMKQRSQDLPPLYGPTGAIWIAERDALAEAGTFYGPGHVYFPMEWEAAVDIDDEADLRMAEAVARMAGNAAPP